MKHTENPLYLVIESKGTIEGEMPSQDGYIASKLYIPKGNPVENINNLLEKVVNEGWIANNNPEKIEPVNPEEFDSPSASPGFNRFLGELMSENTLKSLIGSQLIYEDGNTVVTSEFEGYDEFGVFILKKPEVSGRPTLDTYFYKPDKYREIPPNVPPKRK